MSSFLSEPECWELLQASTVGRLAFDTTTGPTIRPVNYVVRDRTLIIRTSPSGTIAASADARREMAFEVDYHNATSGSGWSVLMSGTVQVLSAADVEDLQLDRRVVPWAEGDRSLHLRFDPRTIEGRRVQRHR